MRLDEGLPFAPDGDTGSNTGPDPDPLQAGEPLLQDGLEPPTTGPDE